MEIVIAFNEKYLIPAGVMLCSLFENNKADDIHIHALLSNKNHNLDFVQPICDIVKQYGGQLYCYDMSLLNLPLIPLDLPGQRPNISFESYYRLFISKVLPTTINKVLYLDCDIIIVDNLTQLWNEDLSSFAVGAVPDFENNNVSFTNRLGYDIEYGYFNSGILLINLKYWREHDITEHFLNCIKTSQDKLYYHDQDVLNIEFHQQKKELPIRYNFQTTFLFKEGLRRICLKFYKQIDEAVKKPCIIHFTEDKPWYSNTSNPMREYFDKYLSLTIWNGKPKLDQKESLRGKLSHLYHYIRSYNKLQYKNLYDTKYLNILRNGKK